MNFISCFTAGAYHEFVTHCARIRHLAVDVGFYYDGFVKCATMDNTIRYFTIHGATN